MNGAADRYHMRRRWWTDSGKPLPEVQHHFWWVLHNCVSHPALGILPGKATVWFHDYTSQKLNLRDEIRPSPPPQVENPKMWCWHNIAGHLAIGFAPCEASFNFHDRTAQAMDEEWWV